MAVRMNRAFTAEDLHYFRMIEKLANERLNFFRDQKKFQREEHVKHQNIKLKAISRRSWKEEIEKYDYLSEEEDVKERKKSKAKKRPRSTEDDDDDVPKKKKKVPKKAVRKPVVKNEVTERLKAFVVNELNGTDMKLVIQKMLYKSDTEEGLSRLNMPIKQVESDDFLTADEKRIVSGRTPKENEIDVLLLGPTLEVYGDLPIKLKMWHMATTANYVLTGKGWFRFWDKYQVQLPQDSTIQVWTFRREEQLCFAVVCVEEPTGGDD